MQCELCGREENLFVTEVEGIELSVCMKCTKHGKVVRKARTGQPEQVQKSVKPKIEIIPLIDEDYASKIKKAREKLGLTQEEFAKKINEKESQYSKIESGHHEPSIEQAKRIEAALHIKILEEVELQPESVEKGKNEELTIGDLMLMKKRQSK